MATIGWWAEIQHRPTAATVTITGGVPGIEYTENSLITPSAAQIAATGGQPALDMGLRPVAAGVTAMGGQPAIALGELLRPTPVTVTVTGAAPQLVLSDHKLIQPSAAAVTATGGRPLIPRLTVVDTAVIQSSSIALPAHQVGDIIVLFAFNASGTLTPLKPSVTGTVPAWVDIDANSGANTCASRVAYYVATATNTTSGIWNNTQLMAAVVLRGQAASPIGGHAESGGASLNGATAPAVTLTNTDGSSVLLHFFGRRFHSGLSWSAAPAGYTTLDSLVDSPGSVCIDTKDNTTTDGQVTQATGGSQSEGYRGATVEILSS